ncbi:uncharacterized protein [Ptychodera flava]|uniref:uncharacterized protein n=1 Tax=Ptychodera flava TaxID=63121 RepID=UPI00396A8255
MKCWELIRIPMSVKKLELVMILIFVIGSTISLKIEVPNKATAVVIKGRPVQLICSPKLKVPHSSYKLVWYYNGEELKNTMKTTYKIKKYTSLLIIAKTDYSDSGNYSCGVPGHSGLRYNDVTKITVGRRPFATLHCKSQNIRGIYCFWNETFSNLPSNVSFSWKSSFRKKFTKCVHQIEDINSCYLPLDYGASYTVMLRLANALGKKKVKLEFDSDELKTNNKFDSVPVIPITVGATILLIFCGVMGRLLYRKVRGTGVSDPVAKVKLPYDSEEYNSAVITRERQVQENFKVYDDLVVTPKGEPIPGQADRGTQPSHCIYSQREKGCRK